jgi:hypothetical protein
MQCLPLYSVTCHVTGFYSEDGKSTFTVPGPGVPGVPLCSETQLHRITSLQPTSDFEKAEFGKSENAKRVRSEDLQASSKLGLLE